MKAIKDLRGLLMHHLQNLYSAEEQMIKVLPLLIKKAKHSSLKNMLKHHLSLTKIQKKRLEQIPKLFTEKANTRAKKGVQPEHLLIGLNPAYHCKGMEGLVDEANELLSLQLSKDVADAAIITCVQKMEHYEICTYGIALAFAQQLQLQKAEALLQESLTETYDTDELLTDLAITAINIEAEPQATEKGDAPTLEVVASGATVSKAKKQITERSVTSPGGRAGTSHRRYKTGESRGH